MMKARKLLALLMALALCLSLSSAALADGISSFYWEDIAEDFQADYPGKFYILEDVGAAIYVPDFLQEVELTEEDYEEGYLAYFASEEDDAEVGITYTDVGMTLEEFRAYLQEDEEVDIMDYVNMNGILLLPYVDNASDCIILTTEVEDGCLLEFIFYPFSSRDFLPVLNFMGISIQAAEDLEDGAA